MKPWHWAFVGLVLCVACFGAGRYATPTKVTTQTVEHVQYVDRVVTQKAETQVVYRDRTVITHPDGSVERRDVEKTTDKTAEQDEHETAKTDDKAASKVVEHDAPRLSVNGLVAVDVKHPAPLYGGQVEYRFWGPLKAGGFGLSNGTVGVSLGLEF